MCNDAHDIFDPARFFTGLFTAFVDKFSGNIQRQLKFVWRLGNRYFSIPDTATQTASGLWRNKLDMRPIRKL